MPDEDINDGSAIAGAIAVMVMVPMFFLVMPIYVGALADDLGFTNAQIGYLISVELGSVALASFTALFWLRSINWRRVLFVLLIVLAAANLLSIFAKGTYGTLFGIRSMAGFAGGAMMAIALAALGDTRQKDRNFALGVVGQLSVSGVLLLILPFFVGRWGVTSVFIVFLIGSLVALPLSWLVPATGKAPAVAKITERRSLLSLWGLAGIATIFVGQSAVWAFIERLGTGRGLSPGVIGIALGAAVFAGIAGALMASWLADRRGRRITMVISMMGEVTCLLLLLGEFTATTYFIAVILYSIFWNFWVPYQMSAVAATDVSGRFIGLITFFFAAGTAIGPAVAALLLTDDNYDPVIWMGISFAILATVLFMPVTRSGMEIRPTVNPE